jgi:hypothetical protein
MHMTKLLILLVFVPGACLFAVRAYLKTHPPSLSLAHLRRLFRGLGFGVASTLALPLFYIVCAFQQIRFPGSLPYHFPGSLAYVVFALAGNITNVLGLYGCLRKLTGPGVAVASFLLLVQLLWLYTLLGAFMMAH